MKKYKVVMRSWGGVKKDAFRNLTEKEAYELCEDYGWTISPDGGYVWDLEIEEEDE